METVDSNTKQIVVRNFVTRDGAVVGVARHEDRVTIINNPLSPSVVGPVKIPLEILAEVVAFATGRDAGTAAETFEATSGAAAELAALRAFESAVRDHAFAMVERMRAEDALSRQGSAAKLAREDEDRKMVLVAAAARKMHDRK